MQLKKVQWVSLLFALLALTACDDEPTPQLVDAQIKINLLVGDQPLVFGESYTNAAGEHYTVSDFRFYLSNIRLRNTATGVVFEEKDSYHLVQMPAQGNQAVLEVKGLPAGNYDEIEFSIGVDPSKNYSLDNVGDLDPSSKMAWDWNTGYKFLVLEGKYFPPSEPERGLVFHIGQDRNFRTIRFSGITAEAKSGHQLNIVFDGQIDRIFQSPNLIRFSENNTVMFQDFSLKVSENYANMLVLKDIQAVE